MCIVLKIHQPFFNRSASARTRCLGKDSNPRPSGSAAAPCSLPPTGSRSSSADPTAWNGSSAALSRRGTLILLLLRFVGRWEGGSRLPLSVSMSWTAIFVLLPSVERSWIGIPSAVKGAMWSVRRGCWGCCPMRYRCGRGQTWSRIRSPGWRIEAEG